VNVSSMVSKLVINSDKRLDWKSYISNFPDKITWSFYGPKGEVVPDGRVSLWNVSYYLFLFS